MTLTSRPLTSRHNVQALVSDDSNIQTQHPGPWQWWPWHPDTTFRSLIEMNLDIQTQSWGLKKSFVKKFFLSNKLDWPPDTMFRLLAVMTLTSRHNVQALDSDDLSVMTLTSRPLTVMTLTSRHHVQALGSDDPDIQSPPSGPWQWWPWHPDTTFRSLTEMTLDIQTQSWGLKKRPL